MPFDRRWHAYKVSGVTVVAMLLVYLSALARNPHAGEGGEPGFWIVLAAGGVLFVAWIADTAVRQMRRAAR